MRVLGIETASIVCAAAVVEDGRVLQESFLEQQHVHSEMLMKQIDEVLSATRVPLETLAGIAVSIGPGSFTGLRIGLGVAKGLSWATGKPLVAVSTLRAVARRAVDFGAVPIPGLLLAALDARRGEVYCQLFEVNTPGLLPVWDEQAMSLSSLFDEIRDRQVTVTGDSSAVRALVEQRKGLRHLPADIARCSAATVALEGELELRGGNVVALADIEPRYVMEFHPKSGMIT